MADNPLIGFLDAGPDRGADCGWWVFVLARALRWCTSSTSSSASARPRYNQFWVEKVWGRFERAVSERKLSAWTRYRIGRVISWVVVIAVIAIIAGKIMHDVAAHRALRRPAILWQRAAAVMQLAVRAVLHRSPSSCALFWFLSRGGVDVYYPDDIKTRFSDVWGQDHVLERVKENIVFLENPEAIEDRGGYVPGGILLWGPPGTGKTLMAEAVAGETGKPYVFVDPGAFINMFMGVGILKVKALFRKLRKLALRYGGVIVFFDEADSLGNRGIAMGGAPGGGSVGRGRRSRRRLPRLLLPVSDTPVAADPRRDALGARRRPRTSPARRRNKQIVGGMMNGGGGGGGMGTLQALLTELSGLKKPRGFINRVVRRALGMRPKPPPNYRILVMMATNMPEALDEALLRPGRIDRIYRVGYPSKAGRIRTYEGYLAKVSHELTAEQIDKLATITPYATGATIKDMVNEALIIAIRDGRDVITWPGRDQGQAAQGARPARGRRVHRAGAARGRGARGVPRGGRLPDPAAHGDRHRHDREGQRLPRHGVVDQAGGPVHPVAQRVRVRHPGVARLAGRGADVLRRRQLVRRLRRPGLRDHRRLLHGGVLGHGQDGVLRRHGPPPRGAARRAAAPGRRRAGAGADGHGPRRSAGSPTGSRTTWAELLVRAEEILRENERQVLALAHALETHKTLSGEDVTAVFEGRRGPLVDGAPYADDAFIARLREYHLAAARAHREHNQPHMPLPVADPAYAIADGYGTGNFLDGSYQRERQRNGSGTGTDDVIDFGGLGTGNGSHGPLGAPTYDPPSDGHGNEQP